MRAPHGMSIRTNVQPEATFALAVVSNVAYRGLSHYQHHFEVYLTCLIPCFYQESRTTISRFKNLGINPKTLNHISVSSTGAPFQDGKAVWVGLCATYGL